MREIKKENAEAVDKHQRLCHHSDLTVSKLPEDMRRDQFILWRDQLDELLNQSAGLRGVAKILEKVRMWKDKATEEEVRQVRTEGGCEIDAEHASLEKIQWKSEEIFSLLHWCLQHLYL